MSEQESFRISGLKQAVENCLKSGMSEKDVLDLTKAEVAGAARLRSAIQECLSAPKHIKINFYQSTIEKTMTSESILAVVSQAVHGEKETL